MNILLTGASSGIGREAARQLVLAGHTVWGVARRADALMQLQTELGPTRFHPLVGDVSKPAEVQAVLATLTTAGVVPDAVVLNAAVMLPDTAPEYTHAVASQVFATNVDGALRFVDGLLPKFRARGSGQFIAVASTSAFRPDPTSISLPASKAALAMAFRGLRLRYQHTGIQFKIVYFGPVATAIIPAYTTPQGKPKYWFVMSAQAAGRKLARVLAGQRGSYYFPLVSTLPFQLLRILPDTWFANISGWLKRKT